MLNEMCYSVVGKAICRQTGAKNRPRVEVTDARTNSQPPPYPGMGGVF